MIEGVTPNAGWQQRKVQTSVGSASFRRLSEKKSILDVQYVTPPLHVDLSESSLEEGLDDACAYEIGHVRHALGQLGFQLVSQLSNRGKDIAVGRRRWDNDEERDWRDRGNSVHIEPTRYSHREEITGYEGASDAALVRKHVELLIEQRIQNIRDIYQTLLGDIKASRRRDTTDPRL